MESFVSVVYSTRYRIFKCMHFTMSIKNIDCTCISKQEIVYERKNRKLKQRISISTHKTLTRKTSMDEKTYIPYCYLKVALNLHFSNCNNLYRH